jgi:hypothetical protein
MNFRSACRADASRENKKKEKKREGVYLALKERSVGPAID